jgi:cysteinyl-tRNA synthetase
MKTKLASGEWQDEKMSGSLGNVVSARQLIDTYGADLLRYMLLSTHYRRPIEFTDEVITNAKKGFSVFPRLVERMERILASPLAENAPCMDQVAGGLLESEAGQFVKAIMDLKMRFLEMMDDDFNTAGASAVMHELAGQINSFIEKNQLEKSKSPELLSAASAAVVTVRKLGGLLGLFRKEVAKVAKQESTLADDLMKLLIKLRQDARQSKNFPLADAIRNGLTEIGVTLEDRADGTIWRKD